jgi:nicotinate phosphoribosyltransferase
MLNEAGFPDCNILASNSLDEFIIRDILIQGAQVDLFGVGERLITSKSEPVFGGVYKLGAIIENSEIIPKIKLLNQKPVFRRL